MKIPDQLPMPLIGSAVTALCVAMLPLSVALLVLCVCYARRKNDSLSSQSPSEDCVVDPSVATYPSPATLALPLTEVTTWELKDLKGVLDTQIHIPGQQGDAHIEEVIIHDPRLDIESLSIAVPIPDRQGVDFMKEVAELESANNITDNLKEMDAEVKETVVVHATAGCSHEEDTSEGDRAHVKVSIHPHVANSFWRGPSLPDVARFQRQKDAFHRLTMEGEDILFKQKHSQVRIERGRLRGDNLLYGSYRRARSLSPVAGKDRDPTMFHGGTWTACLSLLPRQTLMGDGLPSVPGQQQAQSPRGKPTEDIHGGDGVCQGQWAISGGSLYQGSPSRVSLPGQSIRQAIHPGSSCASPTRMKAEVHLLSEVEDHVPLHSPQADACYWDLRSGDVYLDTDDSEISSSSSSFTTVTELDSDVSPFSMSDLDDEDAELFEIGAPIRSDERPFSAHPVPVVGELGFDDAASGCQHCSTVKEAAALQHQPARSPRRPGSRLDGHCSPVASDPEKFGARSPSPPHFNEHGLYWGSQSSSLGKVKRNSGTPSTAFRSRSPGLPHLSLASFDDDSRERPPLSRIAFTNASGSEQFDSRPESPMEFFKPLFSRRTCEPMELKMSSTMTYSSPSTTTSFTSSRFVSSRTMLDFQSH